MLELYPLPLASLVSAVFVFASVIFASFDGCIGDYPVILEIDLSFFVGRFIDNIQNPSEILGQGLPSIKPGEGTGAIIVAQGCLNRERAGDPVIPLEVFKVKSCTLLHWFISHSS